MSTALLEPQLCAATNSFRVHSLFASLARAKQ
jgi:hypothetical protein